LIATKVETRKFLCSEIDAGQMTNVKGKRTPMMLNSSSARQNKGCGRNVKKCLDIDDDASNYCELV
jgi:hypothetical protein